MTFLVMQVTLLITYKYQGRNHARGSVSIGIRTEVSIEVGWKMSVDGRVSSVDGGKRVSVDDIGVEVNGG